MEPIVYDGTNFTKIQALLGERPGDYTIDKWFLREGWAHKPYFWDEKTRKWLRVSIGDMFYKTSSGLIAKTNQYGKVTQNG